MNLPDIKDREAVRLWLIRVAASAHGVANGYATAEAVQALVRACCERAAEVAYRRGCDARAKGYGHTETAVAETVDAVCGPAPEVKP